MQVLWFAIILYSVGMAVVLHFRPALMFHENGTWKEFGYQRDSRHTIFPFWLFSVVWAFFSYVIATTVSWTFFGTTVATVATAANYESDYTNMIPVSQEEDLYEEEEDEEVYMPPPPPRRPRGRPRKDRTFTIPVSTELPAQVTAPAQPRAGYYIVDPATEGSGLHRYIYYGPNPPTQAAAMNA
jgi:hypothetical protein